MIKIIKVKDTKNYSRYEVDQPGFLGHIYTPKDELEIGSELQISVAAK